jgi:hypothetical protein
MTKLKVYETTRQDLVPQTHFIVLRMKPDTRKVKCFLRPNLPISSKVTSIDEHEPIIPALERMGV